MHRPCTRVQLGAPPREQPPHMLCKQLVSATQGLQPKLVSSRDALLQPVPIQASALLPLFHLLCSRSRMRPVEVAVPTHTHHCLTPLFSCPVGPPAAPQPHPTALASSSHWEGLGQPSTLPSTCPVLGSIVFLQHHDIPAASPKECSQRFSRYTLE